MKNHITKLISALLIGGSISSAIASAPKSVRPGRRGNLISRTMSVAHAPYDHLRGPLENLYGKDELGGALVDKFISLANRNHQRIKGNASPEELAQLGLPAQGAINPALVETWFIYQFTRIPAKERNLYFVERIEELNDSDSYEEDGDPCDAEATERTIETLRQIQEKVERREISWSQVETLRHLRLLPDGSDAEEEEEEEEEEEYLTGELD